MVNRARHADAAAPRRAAIGRDEREDAAFICAGRHYYPAIGLHDGLPAQTAGRVRRGSGRPPGGTTVGGCAHLDQVARAIVVPFGVAMSVVRAGSISIAGDPGLVKPALAYDGNRV